MLHSPELFCYRFLQSLGAGGLLSDASFGRAQVLADFSRPRELKPTATSFASWVFELDKGRRATDEEAKRLGKEGEHIVAHRSGVLATLPETVQSQASEWERVFKDPLMQHGKPHPFTCSLLNVNGAPLKCVPDVVLRHKPSETILILETKVTRHAVTIPAEGWANLAVQLWCYSWIDDWLDAPEVLLAGSIYRWEGLTVRREEVTPRGTRSEKRLTDICAALFQQYGGTVDVSILAKGTSNRRKLRRLF